MSAFVDKSQCKELRPFPGVSMFVTHSETMTVSLVEMEPGAVIERHSHPHEQVGRLISGRAQFDIGEESRIVEAGQMWLIPGGVEHRVEALEQPVIALDVFHPVREDYR